VVKPTLLGLDCDRAGEYVAELTAGEVSGDDDYTGVLPINPRTHPSYRLNTKGLAAGTTAARRRGGGVKVPTVGWPS